MGGRPRQPAARRRAGARARPAARPRRPWLRTLAAWAALGAVLGLLAFRAATVWLEAALPPILSVEDYRREAWQTTRVFAADGSVLAELWRERRTLVPGARIPRHVRLAAVAAEDGDFYSHEGLDLPGIARALWVNLRDGGYRQGASTITQQVARTFYLSQEKTLRRKVLEVFLARKLERHLGKDEILELYLNQIYFGHGRWGLEEAARHYLGKEVPALTPAEAALLMALVPAPERLNPFDAPEACLARRDRVLRDMVARGFLSEEAGRRALAEAPRLAPREEAAPGADAAAGPAPWFVDVVRRRLVQALGEERVLTGGLRVWTSLEPAAQRALDRAVRERLGTSEASPEAAAVVLRARSREVVALLGGTDFARSPFNRAVQARRQAGSTFKPFIFAAGLASGTLRPETTWPNRVVCYRGGRRRWCPQNAGGGHDGAPVDAAEALARSLNVVAVQALRDVGVARVVELARRAGLRSPIPADLTAALGSGTVTPLELVDAYATFAAGGLAGDPVFVRRVEAPDGRVLFAERPGLHRAMPAPVAEALTGMLRGVVEGGTGRAAGLEGVAVAGKTGTTDHGVDAWFVGYTVPGPGPGADPAYDPVVAGVWVGHDTPRALAGASGGHTAAPIWAEAVGGWLGAPPAAASTARAARDPASR